jgi:hypothetical protein
MEAYKQLVQSKTVRAKHVDEPSKGTDDAGACYAFLCLCCLQPEANLLHVRCMWLALVAMVAGMYSLCSKFLQTARTSFSASCTWYMLGLMAACCLLVLLLWCVLTLLLLPCHMLCCHVDCRQASTDKAT